MDGRALCHRRISQSTQLASAGWTHNAMAQLMLPPEERSINQVAHTHSGTRNARRRKSPITTTIVARRVARRAWAAHRARQPLLVRLPVCPFPPLVAQCKIDDCFHFFITVSGGQERGCSFCRKVQLALPVANRLPTFAATVQSIGSRKRVEQ